MILELIQSLFIWFLFHSLEASILACLIFLVQFIFRKKLLPRWQYLLWLLLLFKLLLPWAPESPFSVFTMYQGIFEYQAETTFAFQEESESLNSLGTVVIEEVLPLSTLQQKEQRLPILILSIISILWVLGMLIFFSLIVWRYCRFSAKITQEYSLLNSEIVNLFTACRQSLGVKNNIRIIQTNEVKTPALWGFLSYTLLLPQRIIPIFNQTELKCMFVHELAHVQRKDMIVNWLMYVLLIIHWFNPFLWFAYARMREAQELACDARALTYLERDTHYVYAKTLLKLLEHNPQISTVTLDTGFLGYKYQVKRRIQMIKNSKGNGYVFSNLGVGLLVAMMMLTFTSPITERVDISSTTETSISSPTKAPIEPMIMPAKGRIVGDFTPELAHQTGLALANTEGTPIYAVANGTINTAEYDREKGFYIIISHEYNLETQYAHLSKIEVEVGDQVNQGQPIGEMGSTGKSTGSHLHFTIFEKGRPIDFKLDYTVEGEPFIEF